MMGMFRVAGVSLILPGHLEPVHSRHHDVQQDDVGRLPARSRRGLRRRSPRSRGESLPVTSMASSSCRLRSSSSTIRMRAERSAPPANWVMIGESCPCHATARRPDMARRTSAVKRSRLNSVFSMIVVT